MKHKLFAIFTTLLFTFTLQATEIHSPNGQISVTLHCPENNAAGTACLSIRYGDQYIFNQIHLGIQTNRQDLSSKLRLQSASETSLHTDDYQMITGKRQHCINHANERRFILVNDKEQCLTLIIRAYDDGIAFRYQLKTAPNGEMITNECTSYDLATGSPRWMRPRSVDNEGFYPFSTEGCKSGEWGYPALMEPQKDVFALITESDLQRIHCGTYLVNEGTERYRVKMVEDALSVTGEWHSAWHTLIIGTLADITESTLTTDVATPCQLKDTSWIKPGNASWIYWAHNHGARNCALLKQYVDLAASMHWPYTLIDAEWDQMTGGTIEDVLAYAHSKDIRPILWYNSTTNWIEGAPTPLYRLNKATDREKEFAWLEKQGVKGVKVDFFPTDTQQAINYYFDLLEDAARHHLLVNLHGGTLPWGWQRTYPQLITLESVYGAEWYNNNERLTSRAACHNATLPFTRNVIGSMDYTPGTFSDSQHPHITNYGHELALPILFESGIQHMPDRPETYQSLPDEVKQLLSTLPTTWDDTRLLSGYPGEHAVLARKKGNTWYIAGINGKDTPAILRFSLQRLSLPQQTAVLFIGDGTDEKSFRIEKNLSIGKETEVPCLARGGFVMQITLP